MTWAVHPWVSAREAPKQNTAPLLNRDGSFHLDPDTVMVFGAPPPATPSPASDHASRRAQVIAMIGLVLLALAARWPGLNESLWYDELWSTHVKLTDFGQTLRVVLVALFLSALGIAAVLAIKARPVC